MHENLRRLGQTMTEDQVEAGIAWYPNARREARRIARVSGLTLHRAAGIIAVLSPRRTWSTNIQFAEEAALGNPKGLFADRAEAIVQGARPLDVLSGPKVRAFYRNILGDTEAITVDCWTHRAAAGDPAMHADRSSSLLRSRYGKVAQAFRDVAPEFGLLPSQFQAAIWITIRGEAS